MWRVDRTFDYRIPDKLSERVSVGSLVRIPFGGRRVRAVVAAIDAVAPDNETSDLEEIAGVVVDAPVVPPPLDELHDLIARRHVVPHARVLSRAVPPRVRVAGSSVLPDIAASDGPGPLGGYERGSELLAAAREGAGPWSLLTPPAERLPAVAALVRAALAGDSGGVLVLVPEVTQRSALAEGLAATFGPGCVRLDTAADDGDRARAWLQIANGHRLGVGGRGAAFAPMADLRMVVVEDEGHPAHKEDRAPRFSAGEVARARAALQGALCVYVDTAPSVVTQAAVEQGEMRQALPARRDARVARPVVEVVEPPDDGGIAGPVHARVRDALAAGEPVAVLAPRRGYSRSAWCASCRRSLRCPRCESGLFFHLDRRTLRCPRCALETPAPDTCPSCGASDFRYLGAGSHRLWEQLSRAFPRVPVVRVDADTGTGAELPQGGPYIYVTTVYGTKPSLRPPARTVVVLDADALIRRPDFRAAENAFALLSEMAAWAGPAEAGGRLLVQSSEPGHHAIQAVVRADPRFFVTRELEQRKELSYPPFAELIRVSAEGPARDDVLRDVAAAARKEGARVLGPVASDAAEPGRAREVLIKCLDVDAVALRLRAILPAVPRTTIVRVDVDPR